MHECGWESVRKNSYCGTARRNSTTMRRRVLIIDELKTLSAHESYPLFALE